MKHITCTFVVLMILRCSHASNVSWDFLYMDTVGKSVNSIDGRVDVCFNVNIQKFASQTYLWPTEDLTRQGSLAPVQSWNSGAWLEAYVGDLVDESTIFGRHDYWFYEMAKSQPEYAYGEPKIIEFEKSYYLMFAIEDADDAWAYRLKETTDPPKLYYGWAEYAVSEDGTFRILNSAIDFDGGAMIVGGGAVPEPTSGLLLLLGVACLVLRRKPTSIRP